jgi:hypothetical protein
MEKILAVSKDSLSMVFEDLDAVQEKNIRYVLDSTVLAEMKSTPDLVWQRQGRTVIGECKIRVTGVRLGLQPKSCIPARAEFVLFMLSRECRVDVLADIEEWYPGWCERFGVRRAKFLCWWRVTCCVGGALLESAGRVAEVFGKLAGLK